MYKLKWIFYLSLFGVAAAIGAWLALDNDVEVAASFFGFSLPTANLGVLLLGFFLLGGLTGIVISLIPYLAVKKQVVMLNRKLGGCEKEIAKLRTASLRS